MKTSTTLPVTAAFIASLGLCGCGAMGPKHVEPTDVSKTSRINFSTTSSVENLAVRAFYGEKKCEDFYSGYKVSTLRDVSIYAQGYVQHASAAFRSEEPIVITMGSSFFPARPGRTLGHCYSHLKFTPTTGKEYEITFSEDGKQCWLSAFELLKASDGTVQKVRLEGTEPARGCGKA